VPCTLKINLSVVYGDVVRILLDKEREPKNSAKREAPQPATLWAILGKKTGREEKPEATLLRMGE
jgi:hypothetical protein